MAIQQLLQSRQAGLPPQMMALLELEQAKQALMQSGVAPGTVAGQKIQEAQMLTQPQQPQVDLQDLMPGIQQRAGEMAQAQQPVTQAQLQQAIAQRAAPGIAGLPADVNMAEGGIVGYNGEDKSYVPPRTYGSAPDYEDARRLGIDLSPYDSPEVRKSKLERLQKMREFEGRMKSFGDIPTEASVANEAALKAAFPGLGRERDVVPSGLVKPTTPQQIEAQVRQTSGTSYQPDANLFKSPAPRPPAAAPAAPASGVASLMGPPVPAASDVEYGRQRAAIQQMLEAAQKPTEESPQDKALRTAREAEIARQTGAIEAARKRFTESQEKQKSQDLINYLSGIGGASSLFRGMAQSGQRLSQVQAAREAERIKYMDLLDTRNEAVGKLKLAQLTGDADLARESAKELRKTTMDIQRLSVDLGGRRMADLAREESEAAKTAAQSRENALERASREKMEGMRLEQMAKQTGQMQLANRINAANSTVSSAIEKMDRDLEKRFGTTIKMYQMMKPEDIQKNPALASGYQEYIKEREKIYKTAVEPAVKERDRLATMITAGQDLSKWGEPQVKTGR